MGDSTANEIKIQTLSYLDLKSTDAQKRGDFIWNLKKAFEEIGFVVIKDHPVSADLQKRAYASISTFFDQPLEEKKKYEIPGIGGARGYTPFGREHAKNTNVGDLKEFFHVGVEVPVAHPLEHSYPKNVSVPSVPDFDRDLRELYSSLLSLGMDLLKAIAIILELREDYFDEKVRYGNSILRPIHYPPLKGGEEANALRSSAHEDINLITLLIGASSPGLQVLSRNGQWLPIQTEASEIVVNVGDMLQRLTNYRLISTTHQVVNPPPTPGVPSPTRYSIPFFLHPVSEMSLEALPSCVKAGEKPRDPLTTAGEYLSERLREIGLT